MDIARHESAAPIPGVLVVRPDAPLFYANAQAVRDAIDSIVASTSDIRAVVVDIDANDELDITTTEQLEKLFEGLRREEIEVGVAHIHGPALAMAERSGLLSKIGSEHVFATTGDAASWARSVSQGGNDLG